MKLFNYLGILALITCSSYSIKKNNQQIKDYFTVTAIRYNQTLFQLSWSAHPADNYYKQEYLPAGATPDSYQNMIMIEAVVGDILLKDAVSAKINELKERKKTDPLVNYQIIENKATGEYMLDFLLSQSSGNKTTITEWNMYRYSKLPGKKGIVLFAYSKRGYGAATNSFLTALKTERPKDLTAFAACKIPALTIKP